MKLRPALCHISLFGALLATAITASSTTLGRLRGAVLIGQPLDVSITVTLENASDLAPSCFSADVFFADTRVSESQVTLIVSPGAEPMTGVVRVRTVSVVDEAIASVFLKATCGADVTRRYVLLPDVAADLPSLPANASVAAATAVPSAPPAPSAPVAGAAANPAAQPAPQRVEQSALAPLPQPQAPVVAAPRSSQASPPRLAPAPRPAAPQAKAPATPPKPAAAAAPSPGPRLKLEAAELPATPKPAAPAATAAVGATAAAAAASAAASQPMGVGAGVAVTRPLDEVLADEQRLRTLEAELKSLLEVSKANQAAMTVLQERLVKAESERFNNPLVYVLGAAVLLLAGLVAVLWRRQPQSSPDAPPSWAVPAQAYTPPPVVPVAAPDDDEEPPEDASKRSMPRKPVTPWSRPAPLAEAGGGEFSNSFSSSLRSVNTEELFDIQQQADFFMVLGQHEQAISLLRTHIAENPDTSPLAYLDLLSIYHQLGRRKPFDDLRGDFRQNFNAQVPEFALFAERGRGLEDYPDTLEQISGLWPRPEVLGLIEELVFRDPGQAYADSFDMEAYRDLMLLFSVARLVIVSWGDPSRANEIMPPRLTSGFVPIASAPAPLNALDVDFDLSEGAEPLDEQDTVPPVDDGSTDIDFPIMPSTRFDKPEGGS